MICVEIALAVCERVLWVWADWTHAFGLTPPPEEMFNA